MTIFALPNPVVTNLDHAKNCWVGLIFLLLLLPLRVDVVTDHLSHPSPKRSLNHAENLLRLHAITDHHHHHHLLSQRRDQISNQQAITFHSKCSNKHIICTCVCVVCVCVMSV